MKLPGSIFGCRRLNKSVATLLLLFQAIFLNIIVPGHTRGVITLSGKTSVANLSDLGCSCCCQPGKHDSKKTPTDRDRSECAICHFAARVTLPPVIDYLPQLLCMAMRVEVPAPVTAPCIRLPAVHHDRAPPVIA